MEVSDLLRFEIFDFLVFPQHDAQISLLPIISYLFKNNELQLFSLYVPFTDIAFLATATVYSFTTPI